jgi:hypothetical protein
MTVSLTAPARRSAARPSRGSAGATTAPRRALAPDFSFRDEPPATGLRPFAPQHVVFIPAPVFAGATDGGEDVDGDDVP